MSVFLCPQNGIVLPPKIMVKSLEWHMLGCQVEDSYPWRDVDGGAPKGVWDEFPSYLRLSVWTWSTPTSKGLQSYVSKYLMAILGDYMRDIMYLSIYIYIYIYIINPFLNKPNFDLTVLMEFRHCWDSIWDTPELYWAGTFTSDIELQATFCFTPCMTQVFKMLFWEAAPNWKALKCWKHVFLHVF